MAINFPSVDARNRLNILCVSEHYYPLVGGSVTYVDNICKNMAYLDHNVFLVTQTDNKYLPCHQWTKQGAYFVYNLGHEDGTKLNTRQSRKYFLRELNKFFPELVKTVKPAILHVLYGHYVLQTPNIKKSRIPVVWTVHNVPPHEYRPLKITQIKWFNSMITWTYFFIVGVIHRNNFRKFRYDAIIATSERTRLLLLNLKISKSKVIFIPGGIDPSIFKPNFSNNKTTSFQNKNTPLILCVAAVIKHKGQLVLLEAIRQVIKIYPKAFFVNVGPIRDAHYQQEIDTLINQNSLQNHCSFIATEINVADLVSYYNNCDVYVQPSLEEGFCLTFLEAACCGKPIVGTTTGAIPEILNCAGSDNLCPPGNSECLTNKILKTLSTTQKDKIDPIKQHNKIILNYSWLSVANRVNELYKRTLKQESL